jgi:flagella basal body P-ring formation protein FlgA
VNALSKFVAALVIGVGAVAPARADIYDFLVPSRVIHPGEPLNASDFTEKQFVIAPAAVKHYVLIAAQLDGMEATRTLANGRPVALASIRRAIAVRKGELADAILIIAGIKIEAKLIALSDGSEGTEIAARNPQSGRQVRARVRKDGLLEVLK